MIRLIGYNGRPRIDVDNICLHDLSLWYVENLMVKISAAGNPTYPLINHANHHSCVKNVRFDQAGFDNKGCDAVQIIGCEFVNSGSTSAGSYAAIVSEAGSASAHIHGNLISGWRGPGMVLSVITSAILNNIVANVGSHGIVVQLGYSGPYSHSIFGNTISGSIGDGILIQTDVNALADLVCTNSILSGNGGYGLHVAVGSLAVADALRAMVDYNAFRSNTSGARNGISAGAHDVTLTADPFTNAAGGDFTLNGTAGGGAALKGVAFPTSIP